MECDIFYNNEYDERGDLVKVTESTGAVFEYKYDDNHNLVYIKEIFGKNLSVTVYESGVSARGIQESMRETHVVEDWDIGGLKLGEAIVGYANNPPFRFKFKKYAPMKKG